MVFIVVTFPEFQLPLSASYFDVGRVGIGFVFGSCGRFGGPSVDAWWCPLSWCECHPGGLPLRPGGEDNV
jgi:hypothetical protein